MTLLEHRLRGELRAESELITPESIVPLRLPCDTGDGPGPPRRGGARRWPAWVVPLAAAAAAAVAIAGTFALARVFPGSGPRPASPELSGLPAYYGYPVAGNIYSYTSHGTAYGMSVTSRYLEVRNTATGKLVTMVRPPLPYNSVSMITADASGTMFVLGAMRYWQRGPNTPARVVRRNGVTPVKFLELRITTAGRAEVSSLSLPVTVTPGQRPSLALSPDGTRLALAFGGGGRPAVVEVISLVTGGMRRWVSPPVPWTPLLGGGGAWTANGRTLVLQEQDVQRNPSRRAALDWHPAATLPVRLIDTFGPGGGLAPGRLLVLRPPAGRLAPSAVFVTPDGGKLIAATSNDWFRQQSDVARGELSVYSATTGALLWRLAPWQWNLNDRRGGHGGSPSESVAWSNPSGSQLVLLRPRDDLNILGALTGGTFRTAGPPLPRSAGYQDLQQALRTAGRVTW
jgi:hypothetical protein